MDFIFDVFYSIEKFFKSRIGIIMLLISFVISLAGGSFMWFRSQNEDETTKPEVSEEASQTLEEEVPYQDPNAKLIEVYGGIPESGELVSIDVENKQIEVIIGAQDVTKEYAIVEKDFKCEKVLDYTSESDKVTETCTLSTIEVESALGIEILLNEADEIMEIVINYVPS